MKKFLILGLSLFTIIILSSCGSEDMVSSDYDELKNSNEPVVAVEPDTKAIEAPQLPSASLNPTVAIKNLTY